MDPLITKTIQGVLENTIFNKIIALNLNIPSPILRAVVSRVAEQTAPAVVQEVAKNANFQLNNIPNNRIGSVDPVNIVTGNQGPVDLTNNLTNIIRLKCLPKLQIKLYLLFKANFVWYYLPIN